MGKTLEYPITLKSSIMNDGMAGTAKQRTLMDALDRLNSKVCAAEEISSMSKNLIEKLERTEGYPKETIQPTSTPDKLAKTPDLIDLFDILSRRLDSALEIIETNINRARNYSD